MLGGPEQIFRAEKKVYVQPSELLSCYGYWYLASTLDFSSEMISR